MIKHLLYNGTRVGVILMGNVDKIRLIHVNLTKHFNVYLGETKFEATLEIGNPFHIPNDMELQKVCDIISFVFLKVEKDNNLEKCSKEGFILANQILKESLFEKVEGYKSGYAHVTSSYNLLKKLNLDNMCPAIDSCIDLFVMDGDAKLFGKTSLKDRYVEWFVKNPETKEIKQSVSKKR